MNRVIAIHVLLIMGCTSFDPSGIPYEPGEGDEMDGTDAAVDTSPPACIADETYRFDETPHGYRVYETELSWNQAQARCELDGAYLVAIDDAEENTYVRSLSSNYMWIGLSDQSYEGVWMWANGELLDAYGQYTNWQDGEPNNTNGNENCGKLYLDGTWNDASCAATLIFVCECDPDYTP